MLPYLIIEEFLSIFVLVCFASIYFSLVVCKRNLKNTTVVVSLPVYIQALSLMVSALHWK